MQSATLETRKNENTINKKIYFVLYDSESSTAIIIPPSYICSNESRVKVLKVFLMEWLWVLCCVPAFKKISENFNSNRSIKGHIVKKSRAVGLSTVQFPTSLAAQLPFKSKSII